MPQDNFQQDAEGNYQFIAEQTEGGTCGQACVRMIHYQVNGAKISEEVLLALMAKEEGHNDTNLGNTGFKSQRDIGIMNQDNTGVITKGARNWDAGTYTQHVTMGLRCLRPMPNYQHHDLSGLQVNAREHRRNELLRRTTRKRPAIADVIWIQNGPATRHWIVIAGPLTESNSYLVLDPTFGTQQIPMSELPNQNHLLLYNPVSQKTGERFPSSWGTEIIAMV